MVSTGGWNTGRFQPPVGIMSMTLSWSVNMTYRTKYRSRSVVDWECLLKYRALLASCRHHVNDTDLKCKYDLYDKLPSSFGCGLGMFCTNAALFKLSDRSRDQVAGESLVSWNIICIVSNYNQGDTRVNTKWVTAKRRSGILASCRHHVNDTGLKCEYDL